MGTQADIETRLEELMQAEAVDRLEPEEIRAQLPTRPRTAPMLSPLTRAQERLLSPSQSGVGMVFASEALGLKHVEAAIQSLSGTKLKKIERKMIARTMIRIGSKNSMCDTS